MLINSRYAHSLQRDAKWIVLFVGIIWLVFAADQILPLEQFGLIPRTANGIWGIFAMPFLHGNLAHIIGNTIPLAILLGVLAGSRANSAQIVLLIALLAGVALWLFGREARHIGASGLVFGLIAFHIFAGVFERRLISIAISLGVAFFYAGTLLHGILPLQPGVSWDGHLLGAAAGTVVALGVSRLLIRSDTSVNQDPMDDIFNRRS